MQAECGTMPRREPVTSSVPSESLHGPRSHSSWCWIFLRWSIGELEQDVYHNDENAVLQIRRGGVHQSWLLGIRVRSRNHWQN